MQYGLRSFIRRLSLNEVNIGKIVYLYKFLKNHLFCSLDVEFNEITSTPCFFNIWKFADALDEGFAVTTITSETTNLVYATVSGRADEILADMTLEEKVAQMFLVRCPEENAAEIASEYQFGGYTLFAADFENEIKTSIAALECLINDFPHGFLSMS